MLNKKVDFLKNAIKKWDNRNESSSRLLLSMSKFWRVVSTNSSFAFGSFPHRHGGNRVRPFISE